MKWLDLPPLWLVLCLALAWGAPWRVDAGAAVVAGWACLGVGAALVALAVISFLKTRTTIVPRERPSALIREGIFRITRNPIYLADVLFLLGASLIWGSVLGFVLVPVFAILLDRRFIRGEEATLRAAFGGAYDDYARTTRRWL